MGAGNWWLGHLVARRVYACPQIRGQPACRSWKSPPACTKEHIWRWLGTLGGCGSTVEGWQPSVLGMDDGAALCHRWEPCAVVGNFKLTAIIQSNNWGWAAPCYGRVHPQYKYINWLSLVSQHKFFLWRCLHNRKFTVHWLNNHLLTNKSWAKYDLLFLDIANAMMIPFEAKFAVIVLNRLLIHQHRNYPPKS